MSLVRVALPVPLHRYFDYLLPETVSVVRGARVRVPFGRQTKIGIVVDFPTQSDVPVAKLKPIEAVLDNESIFTEEIERLLLWAARYYHAPIGEVLFSALPVKLRNGDPAQLPQQAFFCVSEQGQIALANGELKRSKKQESLLQAVISLPFFTKPTDCSPAVWKGLCEKGLIIPYEREVQVQTWQEKSQNQPLVNAQNRLLLNKQQSLVVSRLNATHHFTGFLINGVTGSGKTEVYLQFIEEMLNRGKQVLVLVPEIGLTPQTIARFQRRFNLDIEALHSNLSDSERLRVWLKAKNNESAIVIGTRSALFTPFANLGAIIIDEEHDASFKQQDSWRYHARSLALIRAKNADIPIVLGSATPSLESIYNAQIGKFVPLELTYRAGNAKPVKQRIIDLKTHLLSMPALGRQRQVNLRPAWSI